MTLKRSKTIMWLVALSLIAIPLSNAFASGYNLAGTGTKALGMSGAFRAIADDWSAVYWNPAGLAGQGNSVFVEGKVLMPFSQVTPFVSNPYTNSDVTVDVEDKVYPAGSLGLTYKINDKMTAGLGVYAPTAAGAAYKGIYKRPDPIIVPGVVEWTETGPEYDWDGMMMVIDVHPAIGYKVNEKLSVGAGLILKYADVMFTFPRTIYGYMLSADLEGTGFGFGANVGVMYDILPNLHAGLSFTSSSTLGVSGSMTQTIYTPPATVGGFGIVEATPDVEADFPIPMEVGFGLAYDINEKLTVAADVMWTNWASVDIVDVAVTGTDLLMTLQQTTEPTDQELVLNYEDVIRFNIGAAYKFNEKLDLFAGFYYDPSAIPDETIDPAITDFVDKMNFSIAGQYAITPKIDMHLYYEYVFGETRRVDYMGTATSPEENIAGYYDLSVATVGLGVTYKF